MRTALKIEYREVELAASATNTDNVIPVNGDDKKTDNDNNEGGSGEAATFMLDDGVLAIDPPPHTDVHHRR